MEVLKTVSGNYVEDTLEPFKSRKSSIKHNGSTQRISVKKMSKWDLPRLKLSSRNKLSNQKTLK